MNNWEEDVMRKNWYEDINWEEYNRTLIKSNSENIERVKREKEDEIRDRKEIKQRINEIGNSVESIANHITSIHKQLIVLSSLTQSSNETLDNILDKLKENNHINAEIYSALYSVKISTEEQRTDVSANLAKLILGGIDVTSGLTTIMTSMISK